MTVCCVPLATHAQRAPVRVAVGELGAGEGSADALFGAIARTLEDNPEIRVTTTPRAELVVRGSVVRLERRRVGNELEVSCEVSLIVAEARGGSIRAMLRGRGGARGGRDAERLSDDALRAAVRGALRPLASQGHALAALR
jgi:hypothetical protein